MATKAKKDNYFEERVPIIVPRTEQGQDSVTVTVNGINYVIRCGTQVKVPRKVALVLEQSARQEEAAHRFMQDLAEANE